MLSIILPTYNESGSLPELLKEISGVLGETPYEVIVVDDDSPDRTWEVAGKLGTNVKVLRRIGRKGLSSAVIEGFGMAKGETLIVMDADGQHDPAIIPALAAALDNGAAMAVGSRYIPGGGVEGLSQPRHLMSRIATMFALIAGAQGVTDPMSGFFAIRRDVYERISHTLRPQGFKIFLELVTNLPRGSRVEEIPLMFRLRRRGESKLSMKVQLQYLRQVVSLFLRRRGTVLFGLTVVLSIAVLLPQAWDLRALSLKAEARSAVHSGMMRIATENGWIMSDLSLEKLDWPTSATILHRAHLRGPDAEQCFTLTFENSVLAPCAD